MNKAKKKKLGWRKVDTNSVLDCNGFFISYNPQTGKTDLGKLLNTIGGMMGSIVGKELEADGRAETAIVKEIKGRNNFFILNGDYRKQYEKLAPKGFKACMDFFKLKEEFKSGWSD